jgi:hypothetical protein
MSSLGVHQSYMDKRFTFGGRSVQVASSTRLQVQQACKRFGVSAYSGFRTTGATPRSDHRCGYAVDFVGSWLRCRALYLWALAQQRLGRVAYVEPWRQAWVRGNQHVHVSWRRCPFP